MRRCDVAITGHVIVFVLAHFILCLFFIGGIPGTKEGMLFSCGDTGEYYESKCPRYHWPSTI